MFYLILETVFVVMEFVLEKVDFRYSGVLKGREVVGLGFGSGALGVLGTLVRGVGVRLGVGGILVGFGFWMVRISYLEGRFILFVLKAMVLFMLGLFFLGLKRCRYLIFFRLYLDGFL